jgi:hypothetical protein
MQAMAKPKIPGFKTEVEKAEELGKKPRTLRQWRQQGRGPSWVRSGRDVLYLEDNNAWLHAQVVHPVRSRKRAAVA